MNSLFLADLAKNDEEQILRHFVNEYKAEEDVHRYHVLIAYESVGAWGCDSSSWFLLQTKDGNLYEVQGSHCSCYGFEGQFKPELTAIDYLKSERFGISTGGYDDNAEEHKAAVTKWIKENL